MVGVNVIFLLRWNINNDSLNKAYTVLVSPEKNVLITRTRRSLCLCCPHRQTQTQRHTATRTHTQKHTCTNTCTLQKTLHLLIVFLTTYLSQRHPEAKDITLLNNICLNMNTAHTHTHTHTHTHKQTHISTQAHTSTHKHTHTCHACRHA